MMIKLYAIEIFEGRQKYADLPYNEKIMKAIKRYLARMVDDEELLAELTKGYPKVEDNKADKED